MTPLIDKLKDRRDFQNIARNARRWTGSCFVVQARASANPDSLFRFGLTASRKVGNAIVRNRCKRRLREVVRGLAREAATAQTPLKGYDLVIIARTSCATADFAVLGADLRRACQHLGVLPR